MSWNDDKLDDGYSPGSWSLAFAISIEMWLVIVWLVRHFL